MVRQGFIEAGETMRTIVIQFATSALQESCDTFGASRTRGDRQIGIHWNLGRIISVKAVGGQLD
jgi:hypothetical protein